MNTTDKKIKDFDTVKTFREIRDKISKEIKDMTFEQLKEYLDKTKLKPKTSQQKHQRTTDGLFPTKIEFWLW